MNFKNQLKGLTALLMVLGCMVFFNSCEDPIEDPCLLRECGSGTCVESANALDGYFCNCDDGFINNTSDGRCTECADGFYGTSCDSTDPCDDVNFSCPTGASCVSDTTTNMTSCVCDLELAVLSADSTACVCPEGTEINADSTACISLDDRLKFVGSYSQSDIECTSGSEFPNVATVTVTLDLNNADRIILEGFAGLDNGIGHDIYAIVTGNNFTIPAQEVTNGAGTIATFALANETEFGSYSTNADGKKVLAVTYSLTSGTADACTAVLTEI